MLETKWFQFAYCEVPSARDPSVIVKIDPGVHLVTFDETATNAAQELECEIGLSTGLGGPTARILRSTLIKLCENNSAILRGDA